MQGPGWIQEKWAAASLKWTDFVPEDKVNGFVKGHVSINDHCNYW